MRNLAMLNQLWDGASLTIDRRTTESFTVRGARLTDGPASARGNLAGVLRRARSAGARNRLPRAISVGMAGIDARTAPFHRGT